MSRLLSNFKEKKNKQKSQGDEDFEEQESLRHVVVQIAAGTSLRLVVVFVVYIAAAGADVVHMAAGLLRFAQFSHSVDRRNKFPSKDATYRDSQQI
jgi:hypothetical protein